MVQIILTIIAHLANCGTPRRVRHPRERAPPIRTFPSAVRTSVERCCLSKAAVVKSEKRNLVSNMGLNVSLGSDRVADSFPVVPATILRSFATRKRVGLHDQPVGLTNEPVGGAPSGPRTWYVLLLA